MKLKKIKRFQLIFIILVLLVAVKTYVDYRANISFYNEQVEELSEKIADEEKCSEELDKEPDIYSSRERVEKIARERLGLVKSDEKFFKNYNDNH